MTDVKEEIMKFLSIKGHATADQVVVHMEARDSGFKEKPAIAGIHELLAEMDKSKQLKTYLRDGELFYTLGGDRS